MEEALALTNAVVAGFLGQFIEAEQPRLKGEQIVVPAVPHVWDDGKSDHGPRATTGWLQFCIQARVVGGKR
jgi:hypothetical protein